MFLVKTKLSNKLPFQIFPGIFSSIDSYTKTIVHSWFDNKNSQPSWLDSLGKFKGYIDPPHFSKFNTVIEKHNILLTGAPDGILIRDDNTYSIIDYKTAKYTDTQDELLPMYQIQLNAYALIAEKLKYPKVTQLALIYAEPVTTGDKALLDEHYKKNGFAMDFEAHIKTIDLNTNILFPLFGQLVEVNTMEKPPEGITKCKDCENVKSLIALLS